MIVIHFMSKLEYVSQECVSTLQPIPKNISDEAFQSWVSVFEVTRLSLQSTTKVWCWKALLTETYAGIATQFVIN